MSRHRNIRGQNFDEDYEGYDDVYGHSVEEDYMYGASPATAEQFLYRRDRHELSHYLEDIGEDDRNSDSEQPLADSRNYERPKLNDVDEARLQSCLDEIRNVVGDTTPEHVLIDAVIANKFDYERALDAILNKQENHQKAGINTRPDPTLVNPNSPISQDAFKQSNLGGGSRDSVAQRLKVEGQNEPVVNPSGTGKFQSYYDKVAADKDLVRLNIGSKNPLLEGKGSSGCGSGGNREEAMQFYPKHMGFKPQGHMQDHMQSQMPGQLPGQKSGQKQVQMQGQPPMSAGGLSLAELSQMQQTKTNATLGKPIGHVAAADLKPSTGLSHLMLSHPSGSDVRNPLKSTGIEVMGNKSGTLSLADLASGQTPLSVKYKSSMPSNVSLGALASSQLSSSRFPCQKPLSATKNTTQANLSLADLASGHLPMASTIPQMNKQGQTSGLKSTFSGNASLSDLASTHLSSSPAQSLQSNRQSGMKTPGIKSTSAGGLSLSDLASSHLSSSPKQSLMNSKKIGMKAAGIKSTSSGGVSLADLASSHLSSSPDTSALGSLSENLRGTGGTSVISSGVSLSELASADLSALEDASSLGSKAAKKNEKQPDPFRASKSLSRSSSKQHSKKTNITAASASHPGTTEAMADPIGTLDLGMSHHLHGSDNNGSMKPSEGVQRPRVPPGFESFIQPPRHSTSVQHDDAFQPRSHISGTHSRNDRQAKSSGKSNKKQPPKNTSLKSSTHSTSSRDSSALSAPMSTFGNALCHQCRTTSARGRVGYHGVQRRVLHRHFSFERQKSRQEELKEESWRDIRPFDFSTPSPDDIVKERQKGAFVPLNQRPGRIDNASELDSRLRVTQTVDDSASQITRLRFEGKDPKQGFQVNVEDTSKGKAPTAGGGGGGEARGGAEEGETKVEGAGTRKGALSPTRLSETSSSRRSSRESLPNVSSESDLQAYSSATSTPSRKEGRKASSIDIAKELEKRQAGKELLNLVVIGHVDAGKSTLMGHLLYLLGQVNQRVMHKYETESRKQGKASFAYAWVLDETEEERGRGITMDVGLTRFETTHRLVTLLDAPGHKDFIPNMITGAAQADAAILVVDATRGEFETGFESGGQTREHALLVRSLGVRQLVVGVNKLDTVAWSEERFSEIVKKLGAFLKQAGFKESDVVYIPCSGLTGENLKEKAKEPALTSWYSGQCLLDHIDKLKPPKRSIDQSMRLCVSDVFKGMGSGVSVSGKVETGSLQIGEKIMVMPAGENGLIKVITVHDEDTRWACAGDHTTIVVTGIDQMGLTIGSVICSYHDPIRATTRFQARVVIFNIEVPLTKGFPVLVHYQSVSEPAVIKKLISVLHKSTGEVVQKKPKCLVKQMNAIIEIETSRPVCLELYKDYKELGRFMLRYGGSTIAAGVVTELKN